MSFSHRATMKSRVSAVFWMVMLLRLGTLGPGYAASAYPSVVGETTVSNQTMEVIDTGTDTTKPKPTTSTGSKLSYLRAGDSQRREQVQGEISGVRDFKPLQCNSEILKRGSPCNGTWSAMFGTANIHTNRIVIPCGTCVTMNHASGLLTLNGGIDIQGKLVVPDDVLINITTTSVVVQGELAMTSTKPVTGIPKIKVTLVGSTELTFTPIDVNANACNRAATCIAGKKSFVVAGGKVTLNGVPGFTPTWTLLHDVSGGTFNNPDTIVVPAATVNKWDVGAQVVITSHTHDWLEHQVRTIVQKINVQQVGYIGWKLNTPFVRPTTIIESKDFAVEVALLSRNILFEGGADVPASRHGGHFIVYHTPTIVQQINGVELRNFGQQGVLGRYPIHFHHCSNVTGSVVSKNSIRQSNQRCISVHGTDKLKIQENVAYDTKGHCYLTEDGTETGNEFIMNIGIQTANVAVLIPSSVSANNGVESDDEPATFWITNPTNTWIGNVAAGSQNSGFWFDPLLRGPKAGNTDLYPTDTRLKKGYHADRVPLIMFKNNVAHSISISRNPPEGIFHNSYAFRMYTPGYIPSQPATLQGVKAYKNAIGINLHACHKLHLTNSLFADNYRSVDLERSEDLTFSDSEIIGESPSYRQLMARQTVRKVCIRNELTGLRLGTWQNKFGPGYKISNITFSGFNDAWCPKSAIISYDDITLRQGIFETMSTFDSIKLPEGPSLINMCLIDSITFDMLYINDLNGNFRPAIMNVVSSAPATLIASDNDELAKFVAPSKCVFVPEGCYTYCRETCFRTLRVQIQGQRQASWKLKVCLQGSSPAVCVLYKAGRRDIDGPAHSIMAHVPVGQSYNAVVVDSNGVTVVPTFQEAFYEENNCGTARLDISLAGQVGSIPFVEWSDF